MNQPNGFRYISEDRRRAMLDRRAENRLPSPQRESELDSHRTQTRTGGDRRASVIPYHLELRAQRECIGMGSNYPSEQEAVAAELRSAGMFVR